MRELSAVMVAVAAGALVMVLVMTINAVVITGRHWLHRRHAGGEFRADVRRAERARRLRLVRAEDAVPE